MTHLLLKLLINSIKSIFDRDTLHVACRDGKAAGPDEIDLLDRWRADWDLKEVWVRD